MLGIKNNIMMLLCFFVLSLSLYSQDDTNTNAVDTLGDTNTNAVDTSGDANTNAVDTSGDTNTNAVDTSGDTNTSATNDIMYLTLDEALEYARVNSILITEDRYDYEIARARKWQTTSDLYMPSVSIAGSFNYIDQNTAGFGSASLFNLEPSQDVWSAHLDASRVIFSGLRFWNNNKISDINLKAAEDSLLDTEKTVDLNTKLSFYNLFLLQENYRVFYNSDQILKQRLDETLVRYNNGIVSEYEYLSIKVQYENNKPTLISLSNSFYIAKLQFMKDIGLEENIDDVEFVGNVEDALSIEIPDLDEESLIATILQNNYNIRSMEYTLQSLEYARKSAQSFWYPTIAINGRLTTDYRDNIMAPTATTPASLNREWDFGWRVGVTLSYQLDSLIPISRPAQQAKEAKLEREKAHATYINLKDNIEVEGRSLINTIRSQEASLASQKENAATALYAYEEAAKQYNGGTLSLVELNDAQIAYQEAQVNYLQAVFDYYSSTLQLLKLLDI